MEPINTRISVSSSLDGKDLWLLKTFINNKYTVKNLDISYTDDAAMCDVYITQEYRGDSDHHCAILKASNTRLPILPYLNPVTLKKLFLFLGKEDSISQYKLNMKRASISQFQIYKFINFSSAKVIEVIHNSFHLVLDNINEKVYCSHDLNEDFVQLLKSTSIETIRVKDRPSDKSINPDYDEMNLASFKWHMGIGLYECLFDKQQTKNCLFQQIDWPDYGSLNFPKEYIHISALLSAQAVSYQTLISRFKVEIVNGFLNALFLTKSLKLIDQIDKKNEAAGPVKHSRFLTTFKMFLNKIHF